MSDTIDALITLGYPQSDARKVVQQLIVEKPEITKANDAIKEALKLLG
jgi:Holliday junction resolvasome RuvABC DNA-binding subunit